MALLRDLAVPYVVIDNLSRSSGEFVDAARFVKADIADRDAVLDVCRRFGVTDAVHFAAYAYVGESVSDPALYYFNNVVKTYHFVSALREAAVNRLVFSSTCATFGVPPNGERITEATDQRPINPYGATKLVIERMLRDFSGAYRMRVAFLRYFNAAGSSEKHALYESHDPETHAIPLAISAALGGKEFTVFGNDFDTPDGTCVRDFIHVDDLASAHILASDYLRQNEGVLALNLGTGRGSSVQDLLNSAARVTGRPVPHRIGARREGDPPILVADPSRAHEILGWSARYQHLDEIVRTALLGAQRAVTAKV